MFVVYMACKPASVHCIVEKITKNTHTAIRTTGELIDVIIAVMITFVTLNILFLAVFVFAIIAFIIKARKKSGKHC